MPSISSVFLVISLILAVLIGPQTRAWSWGPALLALGLAVAAAIPEFWKKGRGTGDFALLVLGTLTVGWFAWRAWGSPVAELAQADLLLLAGAVGAFVSVRAIEGNRPAERVLIWGIALLLLANVVVVALQVQTPSFAPLFKSRPALFPSGFFGHYNEAANYLIASSLIVAAAALFSRDKLPSRLIWGLIAIAGLAAVYFTRSRGGVLGAAVGSGVFACTALVIAKQRGSRWFALGLLAIPMIGLAIGAYLFSGWQDSQQIRNAAVTITTVMDNSSRLHLYGAAVSCFFLHPWLGGGSRSFSWESFQVLTRKINGNSSTHKPEQAHNELLQALTDYGLVGAGLVTALLGAVALVAFIRILFLKADDSSDVWRLGGLAALAGMLVQSSFSAVFHLMPGVLFLGISLGMMSRSSAGGGRKWHVPGSKFFLTAAATACLILILPLGWKGARVTHALWSSHLGKGHEISPEMRIDALDRAIAIWPQSTFYVDRATTMQAKLAAADIGGAFDKKAAERVVIDYENAQRLHPFEPGAVVNRANMLSYLDRNSEAEEAYAQAIPMQGGMEPAFRAHFFHANHRLQKGNQAFQAGDSVAMLAELNVAADQIEKSVEHGADAHQMRIVIHETLGFAREANGDLQGALRAYDFASNLPYGAHVNYRAGMVMGELANKTWVENPSKALGYLIEAKRRIAMTPRLPAHIPESHLINYRTHLDQFIQLLKLFGAKEG